MIRRRKFLEGIRLKSSSNATTLEGEIRLDPSALKFKAYVDGSERTVVTEDQNQTLTNKTHTDPVLNGDVSGTAIDTDDTLAANSDTKIPSQQAVKAYVDNAIAGNNDASEISYDNNITSGLSAINVQDAIDEVENRVDVNEAVIVDLQMDISNHISDAVDAHDASAISNVPSGNLAATDVQAALNELQTEVDSLALDSDLTAHINDAVDAHDASAISSVASGNLAATDVQSALNELQSDIDTRALDSDLTTHTGASSGVHGVTGNVVGTTDTQTLTNKTIQGASIETPVRSDIKQDTQANLETYASTATNGQLVFATDSKITYQIVDNALVPVGSGSGGFNYIENGKAEVDASGWTVYANTSADSKPDDFGGTPAGVTFVRSTSTPLVGDASFLLSKDAANRQGSGAYYEFTAEEGHKVLKHLLSMLSDTSNANIADGDLSLWLVGSDDDFVADFLNISANNPDILAGVPQIFKQFQFNSAKDKYRLCIHIASTNATAYTAKFDEVELGPRAVASGVAGSDTKDTGLSFNDVVKAQTTDPVFDATPEKDQITITRRGDRALIKGHYYHASASGTSAGSGGYYVDLSALGLEIDIVKFNAQPNRNMFGYAHVGTTSGEFTGECSIKDSTGVFLRSTISTADAKTGNISNSLHAVSNNEYRLDFEFEVPILGWSSNAQMSEDLGSRDVIAKMAVVANQAILNNTTTQLNFDTSLIDTVSSVNLLNNSIVIPETGYYDIGANLVADNAATTSSARYVVTINNATGFTVPANGSGGYPLFLDTHYDVVYLTKGTELTVDVTHNSGSTSNITNFILSVAKRASAQTMLETETVAARYTSNAGQSIPNNANTSVIYEDLDKDTHGAYNTSTGEYSIPISGWYHIKTTITYNDINLTTGNLMRHFVMADDVDILSETAEAEGSVVSGLSMSTSGIIYLNRDVVIKIQTFQNSGASESLRLGSARNTFSIARIK